jgi:ABC-2 type transport system permease protein
VVALRPDLLSAGDVLFQKETDPATAQVIAAATVAMRVQAILGASGVDQATLAAAQQPPVIAAVEPQTEDDQARFLVANIGAVLILVGIFSFGFTVLTGVVEEKQNRVVEVVLATVRARDLLMGKVLGIGVLGLVQLAVFVTAALVAALATDRIALPTTTPGAILLLAVWFVLGYLLYSTALGFMGALASRMEEASNASTPITMVAMLSYFIAIFAVINEPDGTVATIATFIPPSAPFVVPLRAAFDAIPPWQIGLSLVITVSAIWVLFSIGARVYAGAVLQIGGRIKLRDAWRSAGE